MSKVLEALKIICEPGATYELRMLGTEKGTVSGYFDGAHLADMAKVAEACSGKVPAVYMTLNPVEPRLLARAANRVIPWAKHTTEDTEILRRRWLPVDFDPKRPAGVSATDEEHEAALERAREVRAWIAENWQPFGCFGMLCDSGNGAHLLYPVELPNTAEVLKGVKIILAKIAAKFSDEKVTVDQKVSNSGRIWKVYGTKSCKGDEVLGQKHRISAVLESASGPKILT